MARRLAIVAAMGEELSALLAVTQVREVVKRAGREIHRGTLDGHEVLLTLSGIGKVAAATTATVLLDAFEVEALVFTGVAGGLHAEVHVGDVVVASELLQHDMDASPLFPRHEVPLTGLSRFPSHPALSAALVEAFHSPQQFLLEGAAGLAPTRDRLFERSEFRSQGGVDPAAAGGDRAVAAAKGTVTPASVPSEQDRWDVPAPWDPNSLHSGTGSRVADTPLRSPRVSRLHQGLIVSGDRFVSTSSESAALRAGLPHALAVEMEGAAVAQVCHDFGTPFAVVRTISDRADEHAKGDFLHFLRTVAAVYARHLIRAALPRIKAELDATHRTSARGSA